MGRTQYGFDAKIARNGDLRYGLAYQLRQALPNAVYVAFTGTPVELVGANTRAVFGDYIDIYDVAQAVQDGATVPIYYEARVAKIELDEEFAEQLDEQFEEVTEELEEDVVNAVAKKWSQVEALVGSDKRLDAVVQDILTHFDARVEAIDGKAMIVCMSRRICVDVYERIVALRPEWHGDSDVTGAVKVVITGDATDPVGMKPHIRSKTRQESIRQRYKDPKDPLKLVIVRDMWLTGFDAPCMHTLYVDKPMKGHGLMQAVARVNRVFKGKPAGLIVDYIGIAADLTIGRLPCEFEDAVVEPFRSVAHLLVGALQRDPFALRQDVRIPHVDLRQVVLVVFDADLEGHLSLVAADEPLLVGSPVVAAFPGGAFVVLNEFRGLPGCRVAMPEDTDACVVDLDVLLPARQRPLEDGLVDDAKDFVASEMLLMDERRLLVIQTSVSRHVVDDAGDIEQFTCPAQGAQDLGVGIVTEPLGQFGIEAGVRQSLEQHLLQGAEYALDVRLGPRPPGTYQSS